MEICRSIGETKYSYQLDGYEYEDKIPLIELRKAELHISLWALCNNSQTSEKITSEKLKFARKACGYTVSDIASIAKYDANMIAMVETGYEPYDFNMKLYIIFLRDEILKQLDVTELTKKVKNKIVFPRGFEPLSQP